MFLRILRKLVGVCGEKTFTMPWELRHPGAFIAAASDFSTARIRHRDTARELGAKAATLAAAVAGEAAAANVKFAARAEFTAFYLNLVFSVPELERAYDAVELLGFRVLSTPAAARQGKKAPAEESAAVNVARARLGYLWQLLRKGHADLCTAPAAAGELELQGSDSWELSQLVVAGAGAAAGGGGEGGAAAHAAAGAGGEGRAAAHAAAEPDASGADSEAELSEGERAAERAQADGGGSGSGGDAEKGGAAARVPSGGGHSDDEDGENCDIKVLPAGAKRALSPLASPASQQQPPLAKRAPRAARGAAASGGGGDAAAFARYPRRFRDVSGAGDVSRSSSSSSSSSSSGSSSASQSPAAAGARAAAIAYAAAREHQLDAAATAAVDQPLVQKMAAAGAPVPLAVRALALAREAVRSLDPGAGQHYVRGLKNSIKGLAEQLVEARDRVAYLENQCKMWRDAAMGKGSGEGGEGELEEGGK